MKIVIYLLSLIFAAVVFQSCDKQVSVSPPEGRVPLGSVFIDSNPKGANIYVDGRNTGLVTPDSMYWLDETDHFFTLILENYRDTSFVFKPEEGHKIFAFIDYHANPKMLGRIFVKTNVENSDIFVNDSATGRTTPDTLKNIIPGTYKITTRAPEHREDSAFVLVKSNITENAAFMLRDTSVWVDYSVSTSPLTTNDLTAVGVDHNNIKWIGTHDDGIFTYDDKNWVHYTSANSPLPDDLITDIEIDSNNNVWIGTHQSVALYQNGVWTVFTGNNTPMLDGRIVTSIEVSEDGQLIYVGTTYGLLRYNWQYWILYNVAKTGLPHRWVSALDFDEDGNLWIGTNGLGVVQFTPDEEWIRYYNPFNVGLLLGFYTRKFPSNYISAIGAAGTHVFFGHTPDPSTQIGGMSAYLQSSWRLSFTPLPSDIINNIIVDNDRYKWVCTNKGILYFYSFGARTYFGTENSGLLSDDIRDIAFDRKHNYAWVATFRGGLFKFKRGN